MENKNAFLDTSVIISNIFGSQKLQSNIKKTISELNKYSTSFTKKEINYSILKDSIFLYSMLIEEMDLTVVFERLQKYPFTSRRKDRCLAIFSKITNKRELRLEDAITRLESLINGLHDLLFKDISLINSKTNCPLIEAEIEKSGQIYKISLLCRRETAVCDLSNFLKNFEEDLKNISTQENIDPKISELIDNILVDFSFARGRNCLKLGDIIICLEESNNYPIYSTNIKDFILICRALNKRFVGIKY